MAMIGSRIRHSLAVSAALVLAPALQAQSWLRLPNGELGYVTDYTTTGFFQCGESYAIVGSCAASGNSITLGSNGNFLTLVFHGISQVILATNVPQRQVIGSITKSFTGPSQFTFPTSRNVNTPLFFLSMLMSTSQPQPRSFTWLLHYYALSLTNIPCNYCDYVHPTNTFPTSPPPSGYGYTAVDWSSLDGAAINVYPGSTTLTATAAITPEPSTLLLAATGCVGLVPTMLRLRRRRRSITQPI